MSFIQLFSINNDSFLIFSTFYFAIRRYNETEKNEYITSISKIQDSHLQ